MDSDWNDPVFETEQLTRTLRPSYRTPLLAGFGVCAALLIGYFAFIDPAVSPPAPTPIVAAPPTLELAAVAAPTEPAPAPEPPKPAAPAQSKSLKLEPKPAPIATKPSAASLSDILGERR